MSLAFTLGVNARGFVETSTRLAGLKLTEAIAPTMERLVGGQLLSDLRVMPPQAHRPAASMFTPKQRRYFFMALRKGIISVPYQRTGALVAAWRVSTTVTGTNVVAAAVNDSPVAQGVQGSSQWWMHKSVWEPASNIFARHKTEMREQVLIAYYMALKEAIG